MKIFDLSLTISKNMLVWPKDPKPKITSKTDPETNITLSKVSLGSHSGTHVDAPRHYYKTGISVDKIELEKLVGPCKVIDLTNFFKTGGPAEIGWAHFGKYKVKKGDRLLIKTGSFNFLKEKKFRSDYISLSQDAAKHLALKKVSLVGIDYLGIEKKDSVQVHKILLKEGIVIVEGLNLKEIKEGNYTLVCAPLKLEGVEGSPARVFLLQE